MCIRDSLETDEGLPVLRPNSQPLDSDGQGFYLDLTTDPSYADDLSANARAFHWQFSMPARHVVPDAIPLLSGSYRLRVSVPSDPPTEIVSAVFAISDGSQ